MRLNTPENAFSGTRVLYTDGHTDRQMDGFQYTPENIRFRGKGEGYNQKSQQ